MLAGFVASEFAAARASECAGPVVAAANVSLGALRYLLLSRRVVAGVGGFAAADLRVCVLAESSAVSAHISRSAHRNSTARKKHTQI